MVQHIGFTFTALLISSSASAEGIVVRAETTDLRRTNGTVAPRVVRDKNGNVTRLLLNDMKLSPEDVAELGSLEHLRGLVLLRTNFTDGDLAYLKRWRQLQTLCFRGAGRAIADSASGELHPSARLTAAGHGLFLSTCLRRLSA